MKDFLTGLAVVAVIVLLWAGSQAIEPKCQSSGCGCSCPADATQVAPPYTFDKGRPTWLLVRSESHPGGTEMDTVFAVMKSEFAGKVEFRKLSWEDNAARNAIESLSLSNAPASVLADSDGRIVEKFEGKIGTAAIKKKLASLLEEGMEKEKSQQR